MPELYQTLRPPTLNRKTRQQIPDVYQALLLVFKERNHRRNFELLENLFQPDLFLSHLFHDRKNRLFHLPHKILASIFLLKWLLYPLNLQTRTRIPDLFQIHLPVDQSNYPFNLKSLASMLLMTVNPPNLFLSQPRTQHLDLFQTHLSEDQITHAFNAMIKSLTLVLPLMVNRFNLYHSQPSSHYPDLSRIYLYMTLRCTEPNDR
jgi:hypothetical protein